VTEGSGDAQMVAISPSKPMIMALVKVGHHLRCLFQVLLRSRTLPNCGNFGRSEGG
jgi:hypothetical protein